jgi:hypothetical protein
MAIDGCYNAKSSSQLQINIKHKHSQNVSFFISLMCQDARETLHAKEPVVLLLAQVFARTLSAGALNPHSVKPLNPANSYQNWPLQLISKLLI